MPLYFSRPLRRIDYFLGKLGVIAVVPRRGDDRARRSLAYVARASPSASTSSVVRDTWRLLAGVAGLRRWSIVLSAGTADAGDLVAVAELAVRRRRCGSGSGSSAASPADVLEQHDAAGAGARSSRTRPTSTGSARRCSTPTSARTQVTRRSGRAGRAGDAAADGRPGVADRRPLVSDSGRRRARPAPPAPTPAAGRRGRRYRDRPEYAPQYPWYWSAGVLAGLFGLSAWILNDPRQVAGPLGDRRRRDRRSSSSTASRSGTATSSA